MTQDEVIEMACQTFGGIIKKEERKNFLVFAKLVAEKEREACAAICDELHEARAGDHNYFKFAANAIKELRAKQ